MSKSFIYIFCLTLAFGTLAQNRRGIVVSESETQTDTAEVEEKSLNFGELFPKLTRREIQELTNPQQGMVIFNVDRKLFQIWSGTEWVNMGQAVEFDVPAGHEGEPIPYDPPASPSNLEAFAISHERVDLKWRDNSDDETRFEIWRSTAEGRGYQFVDSVDANMESYSNLELTEQQDYYYVVLAINNVGGSDYSNEATTKTAKKPEAPKQRTQESINLENYLRVGTPTGKNLPVQLKIRVLDNDTEEPIIGVAGLVSPAGAGFITDVNGEYTVTSYSGRVVLDLRHVSYRNRLIGILLVGPGEITIYMKQSIDELDEVVIAGNAEANVRSTTIGKNELSIERIRELPLFAGQVDIIKSLTLLPGVSSTGEISSGLNVRGGQVDNNLVLMGGAPIYNPSHLFGFFSAINSDVVRNVSLYKGGIPAKYGGRSSSVLDILVKDGDFQAWNGEATVGIVSSNLALDGPIRDNLSVLVAGRGSYANWLLGRASDEDIKSSSANFYDTNAMLSFLPNDDHKLDYRFYRSYDDFNFISDTTISWQNTSHVLNWDYALSESSFLATTLSASRYDYSISNSPGVLGFNQFSKINDTRLTVDYLKDLSNGMSVNFGVNATMMEIEPGEIEPKGNSAINPRKVDEEKGLELAGFGEVKKSLSSRLAAEFGLRYNHYSYLGPGSVTQYEENRPLSETTETGEEEFGSGETIQSYSSLNPRLGLRFSLNDNTSIKAGVGRQSQYIHLISNTTTFTPTDTWKLSDTFLKPNEAWIFSLGWFKNIGFRYEFSVEGYYKPIENVIEYKDGAELQLNDNLETELLNAEGRSYGAEVYLKKSGRLSGWLSYTYSRSLRRVENAFADFEVNNGDWFPANFDTPNNLSVSINYVISKQVEFSSTFVYSDGKPTSLPSGKLEYLGNTLAYFSERNGFRVPDYHRLDVSWIWSIKSNKKLLAGDLIFSIYNVYGRRNAYSIFFDDVFGAPPQAFKLSILGSAFPSISYKVKFL